MHGLSRSLGIGICLNSWKTLNMNQDLESQASLPSCWVADLEWAEIWRLIAGDTICAFLQSPLVSKSYCSPVVAQYQQSLPSTRTTSMTSLSKLLSCKGGRRLEGNPSCRDKKHPAFDLCTALKSKVMSFFFSFLLRLSAFPWVSVKKVACLRHGMVFLCFMPFESQLSDPMEQSCLTNTSVSVQDGVQG